MPLKLWGIRDYNRWAMDYYTFLKVSIDCSPDCCKKNLQSKDEFIRKVHGAKWAQKVTKHADRCLVAFLENGLGPNNTMRAEMGYEDLTDGLIFDDDLSWITKHVMDNKFPEMVKRYNDAVSQGLGLQSFPRPGLKQFYELRKWVLADLGDRPLNLNWLPSASVRQKYAAAVEEDTDKNLLSIIGFDKDMMKEGMNALHFAWEKQPGSRDVSSIFMQPFARIEGADHAQGSTSTIDPFKSAGVPTGPPQGHQNLAGILSLEDVANNSHQQMTDLDIRIRNAATSNQIQIILNEILALGKEVRSNEALLAAKENELVARVQPAVKELKFKGQWLALVEAEKRMEQIRLKIKRSTQKEELKTHKDELDQWKAGTKKNRNWQQESQERIDRWYRDAYTELNERLASLQAQSPASGLGSGFSARGTGRIPSGSKNQSPAPDVHRGRQSPAPDAFPRGRPENRDPNRDLPAAGKPTHSKGRPSTATTDSPKAKRSHSASDFPLDKPKAQGGSGQRSSKRESSKRPGTASSSSSTSSLSAGAPSDRPVRGLPGAPKPPSSSRDRSDGSRGHSAHRSESWGTPFVVPDLADFFLPPDSSLSERPEMTLPIRTTDPSEGSKKGKKKDSGLKEGIGCSK